MSYLTYIVECSDGTLYTGWTSDIEARLAKHNSGRGARYTRSRLPVKLLGTWQFESKQEAMSFEWHVKQLPRNQKLALLSEAADNRLRSAR